MQSTGFARKLLFFIGIGLIVVVAILGYGGSEKRVLLIFSYHPDYPWHVEEAAGAEEVLLQEGIIVEKFFLDTKRHTSVEWKEQVSTEADKKIEEFGPDLVIVFDDNACELVAKRYIGKPLPFVFCGVNADPATYGFPAENITGALERPDVNRSIELLQMLVPRIERVALITDASPTSQGFIKELEELALPVEMTEIYTTDDFADWQRKVIALQSEVDAIGLFVYHTLKGQGEDVSMPPDSVLGWTLENNRLPEFALLDFTIQGGALCGVVLSAYDQGKTAAEMANRILAGESPSDIPVAIPEASRVMINAKRATELGIELVISPESGPGDEPLLVGVYGPITGPASEAGIQIRNGAVMAMEEINATGGILGRPIKLVFGDTQSNPAAATVMIEKLIAADEVDLVTGGLHSDVALATMEVTAEYGVPQVMNLPASSEISRKIAADPKRYQYVVKNGPPPEAFALSLAEFLEEMEESQLITPQSRTLAVIRERTSYGLTMATSIRENLERIGWKVTAEEVVELDEIEYLPVLSRIQAIDPDVVLALQSSVGAGAALVKQYADQKTKALLFLYYLPSDPNFLQLAGGSADGLVWMTNVSLLRSGKGQEFSEKYTARWGVQPAMTAALQYDLLHMIRVAYTVAGSFDPDQFANAFLDLRYDGTTGTYAYNSNNHEVKYGPEFIPQLFYQIQDQENSVIWPKDYAETSYVSSLCSGDEELSTIGVFQFSSNVVLDETIEGFLQAMEDAGYESGSTVCYRFENAEGDIPTAQRIAKQLAASNVDLIFVVSTPALQAVLNEVKETPIVFGAVANPYIVGAGRSAQEHLPNVTGASSTAPMRQALELMLEALPDTKRVGCLWDPANANTHYEMEAAREAAAELDLEIVEVTINGSDEVLKAAQTLSTMDIDALFTILDNVVMDVFDSLAQVADAKSIPLIAPAAGLAERGAAIGVGWDYFDNGYLSGQLAVRVMNGEEPADIPFQPLIKKVIYVNPAAAKRQGFTIPASLLKRADRIIGGAQ